MVDNVALYHSEVSYKEPLLMFRTWQGPFRKSSIPSLGPDFIHLDRRPRPGYRRFRQRWRYRLCSKRPRRLSGAHAQRWGQCKSLAGGAVNWHKPTGTGSALSSNSRRNTVHVQQSEGGTSYMSASDPRIYFGLGKRSRIESLVITWPSGQVDTLTSVPIDTIVAVKEGAGIVPRSFPKVPAR